MPFAGATATPPIRLEVDLLLVICCGRSGGGGSSAARRNEDRGRSIRLEAVLAKVSQNLNASMFFPTALAVDRGRQRRCAEHAHAGNGGDMLGNLAGAMSSQQLALKLTNSSLTLQRLLG